jgi:secreted trypsin-like serine protease
MAVDRGPDGRRSAVDGPTPSLPSSIAGDAGSALDRSQVLRLIFALLLLMAPGAAQAAAELPFRVVSLSPPPAMRVSPPSPDLSHPAIVGGSLAADGAWPMTVFLTLYTSATSASACGGTVVAPFVILTAAHCVASDSGQVSIIAASATVASNDAGSTQTVFASQVSWHSSYRGAGLGFDIALLRLAEPVTVDPVSLSAESSDATLTASGATATAVGWGTTSEGGVVSQFLRQVDIPVVANATCAGQLGETILATWVCAGATEGGRDTCQGDSGGPLFVRDTGGTYRQVGITSFGFGCARPLLPGVYTRVASYRSWIESAIAGFGIATQYSGWWWNDDEPGTGFSFEKRGSNMFVSAFLYRGDGTPVWYVASGPMTSDSVFSADLTEFSGGQSLGGAWQPAAAASVPARLTVTFTSPSTATMTIGSRTIAAQRFPFHNSYAVRRPTSGLPETGWWWDASEPGRGFFFEFQDSSLFFAAYMYDSAGTATWYLASGAMTSITLFTGTLQQFSGGQTLTGSWRSALPSAAAGTLSVSFSSTTTATMVLPNGTSVPLTRFTF